MEGLYEPLGKKRRRKKAQLDWLLPDACLLFTSLLPQERVLGKQEYIGVQYDLSSPHFL